MNDGGDDDSTHDALDEGEVREHAVALGIDPDSEPHLLWIARQSLSTPLPPNWWESRRPLAHTTLLALHVFARSRLLFTSA